MKITAQFPLNLKELLNNSARALGNILLLMGGDDSVDVSFKPHSPGLLKTAPLAGQNNERQNA